ncbi:hypothetical protein RSC2_01512 [Bacillus paralicheniformis]|nr:hypothetical protein RSC2_01512 [Bacillus paralicheniformis]
MAQGEKITVSGGVLNVPNNPVIPFIEGTEQVLIFGERLQGFLKRQWRKRITAKRKSLGKKSTPGKKRTTKQANGFLKKRLIRSANT